ncbi:MAG: CHASE3 domain-containing protein [Terracidiphilus sp.]|jgi:PAS domain S-box-containing protein
MRIPYKRIGVSVGFSLLLVLLIVNATVTRRKLGLQIGAESWVSHTRQVLFELNQLQLLLADAEAEKRGYLYTGDSRYLAPYRDAISKIEPEIDAITNLTTDNPRHQAMIPELRNRVHAKVAEMAQVVALYQSGKPEAARELVLTATDMLLMDHVRLVITQMEYEETQLESSRVAAYQRAIHQTISSIYLANLLAFVGLVLLSFYILREMDLREGHARELRAREEWFRVTLTSIGDAVIATDKQGAVTFLNPVAETLTGIDLARAKGRNVLEIFTIINEQTHKPAENPVTKVLEVGQVVGLANHTALQRKDGTEIPIEDSAAPIRGDQGELLGVVLVFRDVTDDRKAREIMRRTERLAAAARLSATMAHEINNPLQAVGSLLYLARSTPDTPPGAIQHLALADQELKRVAHITQQTLGFYRDSHIPEVLDLPALVESVITLYSNKLQSKDIRVERRFGACPPVIAVSGEIKQVISNLMANAADAVDSRGTITVTLGSTEHAGCSKLQILIEDDGPGIPPKHVQQIFEPFFTTKQEVGTGLGLWLSKEIVERYGGSIQLVPRGRGVAGAAFSILLPASSNSSDGAASRGESTTFQLQPDSRIDNGSFMQERK